MYRSGLFEEAISSFRQGMDRDPARENPNLWLGMGLALARIGRDEEAGHWLAKARQWFADHPSDRDYYLLHPHDRTASRLLLREAGDRPGG
jgi:Flp pilus assembly protein TadD